MTYLYFLTYHDPFYKSPLRSSSPAPTHPPPHSILFHRSSKHIPLHCGLSRRSLCLLLVAPGCYWNHRQWRPQILWFRLKWLLSHGRQAHTSLWLSWITSSSANWTRQLSCREIGDSGSHPQLWETYPLPHWNSWSWRDEPCAAKDTLYDARSLIWLFSIHTRFILPAGASRYRRSFTSLTTRLSLRTQLIDFLLRRRAGLQNEFLFPISAATVSFSISLLLMNAYLYQFRSDLRDRPGRFL